MPDWKKFGSERLQLKGIHPQREMELIEDLAQQLEDIYQEALRNGNDSAEASVIAEQHIPDWEIFSTELNKFQHRHQEEWNAAFLQQNESWTSVREPEQFVKPGFRQILAEFLQDLL